MYINGQKQVHGPGSDYTVSGTTVTYSGPLTLDTPDIVEFWYVTSGLSVGGGGGGSESLADTLAIGNVTGGNNLIISVGDSIQSAGTDVTINDNLIVNGKLTVSGLIDPTGLIFEQASAPSTTATEGAIFVSDGTGGLIAGTLYFRPANNGTTASVAGPGAPSGLSGLLGIGNTTGSDATTSGSDIVFSGAGTQDSIKVGGTAGTDFTIEFSSAATAAAAGITISAQNAGGTSIGGDITINTGDAGTGGTAGNLIIDLGDPNGGTAGIVDFRNNGTAFIQFTGAGPLSSTALLFGTSNSNALVAPGVPLSGAGINLIIGGNNGASSGDNGGNTQILSGSGNGTGTPGSITVQPGTAGATSDGGNIIISATDGGATSGNGGDITVTSGSAASGTNNGGLISVTSGDGNGAGDGGEIRVTAGNSGAGATGDGGAIAIISGTAVSTAGDGGVIVLSPGLGGSSGSDGYVIIESALNMTANFINDVLDPVLSQDAATKAYVDSRPANEISFRLSGIFSGVSVPGTFDPSYPITSARTISSVKIVRRTAGSSGTTTVDILKNGVSVFGANPKPSVTFTDGDNAIDTVSVFSDSAFAIDDLLDVELETVESGSVEDLCVIIRFA